MLSIAAREKAHKTSFAITSNFNKIYITLIIVRIMAKPIVKSRFEEWKKDIKEHKNKILLAFLFLGIGLLSTAVSSHYVDQVSTISVPDLILDAIPVVNLSFLFEWGIVLVIAVYLLYPLLYRPRKFHYALGMLSLFLLVRSAFIVLTHLKAPVGAIPVATQGVTQILTYSNDLFFSGHAGLPFLGFLIYKDSKVRYFFLSASIILAMTVLLMHVHYSIDVASAYFITYGIYVIGDPLFSGPDTKKKKPRKSK